MMDDWDVLPGDVTLPATYAVRGPQEFGALIPPDRMTAEQVALATIELDAYEARAIATIAAERAALRGRRLALLGIYEVPLFAGVA